MKEMVVLWRSPFLKALCFVCERQREWIVGLLSSSLSWTLTVIIVRKIGPTLWSIYFAQIS
jgi:hypothetical protein